MSAVRFSWQPPRVVDVYKRQDLKTAYVEDYLLTHKSFSFMDLMEKQRSKMEIIVTFMVILELMKTGKITIVQEDIFDDIWITSKAG